jgi:hypothetical protein
MAQAYLVASGFIGNAAHLQKTRIEFLRNQPSFTHFTDKPACKSFQELIYGTSFSCPIETDEWQ